jgi:hypothetical protein
MSSLSDLIASSHAAVYTYGVVSAFAHESSQALDYQATHRRMRDQLIALAETQNISIPAAQAAYSLPIRVHNNATAHTVAATLENSLCAQWAAAISTDDSLMTNTYLGEPEKAAVRAFSWNQIAHDFPT